MKQKGRGDRTMALGNLCSQSLELPPFHTMPSLHWVWAELLDMAEQQSIGMKPLYLFEPWFMLRESLGLEDLSDPFRLQYCIDLKWFHFIYWQ